MFFFIKNQNEFIMFLIKKSKKREDYNYFLMAIYTDNYLLLRYSIKIDAK